VFNVLFASGKIMEFGTIDIATIYATAYKGTLLPNITLDRTESTSYNDCVVNDIEEIV
jgi:hypothetical protein